VAQPLGQVQCGAVVPQGFVVGVMFPFVVWRWVECSLNGYAGRGLSVVVVPGVCPCGVQLQGAIVTGVGVGLVVRVSCGGPCVACPRLPI
jgi:hypothetical protein